jgi:hypothetical protein
MSLLPMHTRTYPHTPNMWASTSLYHIQTNYVRIPSWKHEILDKVNWGSMKCHHMDQWLWLGNQNQYISILAPLYLVHVYKSKIMLFQVWILFKLQFTSNYTIVGGIVCIICPIFLERQTSIWTLCFWAIIIFLPSLWLLSWVIYYYNQSSTSSLATMNQQNHLHTTWV